VRDQGRTGLAQTESRPDERLSVASILQGIASVNGWRRWRKGKPYGVGRNGERSDRGSSEPWHFRLTERICLDTFKNSRDRGSLGGRMDRPSGWTLARLASDAGASPRSVARARPARTLPTPGRPPETLAPGGCSPVSPRCDGPGSGVPRRELRGARIGSGHHWADQGREPGWRASLASKQFPPLKQVDVFMTIQGVSFRGRAEIVGPDETREAELHGGLSRHNLRWVALHAHGVAALSRAAPSD